MKRRRRVFYRDPHFWSALAAALAPVLINHLPQPAQSLACEVYGALCCAGIITARRQTGSELAFSIPQEKRNADSNPADRAQPGSAEADRRAP